MRHLFHFLVSLFVHAKFVLLEGWKYSILNVTLQKMYHVIQVHALTKESALMSQEEATAVNARGDAVVKHVMKVKVI